MSAAGPVLSRREGPLLRLCLARPQRRNAFDPELMRELGSAFAELGDARGVVLSGEGSSFSAGADVGWMAASIELGPEENLLDVARLRELLETVDACPVPVVAAVQGHALGGALGLLACCDIVLASPETVFAFSEVKLGLVPAVVSPFVLARIGSGAARRLFVTGERFGVETALRIGLVHEVVEDLDAAVERIGAEIASAAPEAVREAKRLARSIHSAEECAQALAERRTSAEGQEGVRAFLERRSPAWLVREPDDQPG
jgi:methylglutaconyl-CoA hydratase